MSLLKKWQDRAYVERTQEDYDKFWGEYLPSEQKNYEYILEHKDEAIEGTLLELSGKFDMDTLTFTGFLDGINTSLNEELDVESLAEESDIKLSIDFEKLYYNMHVAKADWLYNLPQWDSILTEERRKELQKIVKKTGEEIKVAIRNERREANDKLKKMNKSNELTEDDLKRAEDEVQKMTDKYVKEVDELISRKEAEILEV